MTDTLTRDFEAINLCIQAGLLDAADVGLGEVRLRTCALPATDPARQRLATLERQLADARALTSTGRPIAVGLYRDLTGSVSPPYLPLCQTCADNCLNAGLVTFIGSAQPGARCSSTHT